MRAEREERPREVGTEKKLLTKKSCRLRDHLKDRSDKSGKMCKVDRSE